MTDKRKQLRVGLFTIIAAALVVLVVIVFGGIKFWRHHVHYYVEFDHSVIGLLKSAQVYLNGVEVGQVDDSRSITATSAASASTSRSTPARRCAPTPARRSTSPGSPGSR